MIVNLQKFGQWLNNNNQVDFGKNVKNNDYIIVVSYSAGEFSFKSINSIENSSLNYYSKSCFNENLYNDTDQKVIIPSKSNLLGFTPFFIKLDHKFTKRNAPDNVAIKKFKGKIERSIKANKNDKDFCEIVEKFFNDFEDTYIKQCIINTIQKDNLRKFNESITPKEFKNLIISYYEFLYNNSDKIINLVNDFKKSDAFENKKANFYLTCIFGDIKDMCNDFFYYYSMFIQSTSKQIKDYNEGHCSICGNKNIVYPPLPYYSMMPRTSFNNNPTMQNSKLQICKNCSSFLKYANEKIGNIINNPFLRVIPKNIGHEDYTNFLKISNKEINSFEKINQFLKDCDGFNFDLMIINENRGIVTIKKYIENYKAFLVKFENLKLYNNNHLVYLFDKEFSTEKLKNININNTFDFENIFKEFFYELDDDKYKFPNLFHFYEIYTKDLTGKSGIFNNFTSRTISIFSKYCENIFDFIYEIKLDSLNKEMINEIVLNSLMVFQKNSFGNKNHSYDILKRLNYYFMFKKEFLGDEMLKNENILELKKIFGNPNGFNEDPLKFQDLFENDPALKYYLLGQFISCIDIYKSGSGKNKEVFSNFISNVNRNNIKKLFVTEVLQKNNYYIEHMPKKGKFIFRIFESNIDKIFNEGRKFDFEDYLLLIFTGYYSDNILINNYTFEEDLD